MAGRHVIETALDLARMPMLARVGALPPIPPDIIEIMRIAAANPQACQSAAATTGEPSEVLVEAARFYLQHVLFRPDADCYRVLGIARTDSRAVARDHMRWLLHWLHPDRNSSWDVIYAERVLKAWQEVSGRTPAAERAPARGGDGRRKQRRGELAGIRLPWIARPGGRAAKLNGTYRVFTYWVIPAMLVMVAIVLWVIVYAFGPEQSAAVTTLR